MLISYFVDAGFGVDIKAWVNFGHANGFLGKLVRYDEEELLAGRPLSPLRADYFYLVICAEPHVTGAAGCSLAQSKPKQP
jgi:hypothetical protein